MTSAELAGQMRIPPGPSLTAWLGQAEPETLDDAGLVNTITAWRKITSWAQAQELAAVAEIARRRGVTDDPTEDRDPVREVEADFAPNEIALALTLTQFAAQDWMSLAVSMSHRLPGTLSMLRAGHIDLTRAKLIDQYTMPLDDDLALAVERKVLPRAPRQTTTQLAASLRRAVMAVDPAAAERRRKEAERNARVELTGDDAGTAALSGRLLPAAQASAAWARISTMAQTLQSCGVGGGIDLLRAQVFIGLLLGTLPQPPEAPDPADPGPPSPPTGSSDDGPVEEPPPPADPSLGGQAWQWPHIPGPGEVIGFCRRGNEGPALSVPWRTLAGLSDEPGLLSRIGPITAGTARELARSAAADRQCRWRVLVTDRTGHVLAVTRLRSPGRGRRSPRAPDSCAPPYPPGTAPLGRITLTVPVTILGEPPPHVAEPALRAVLDHMRAAAREALQPLGNRGPATSGASCGHEDAVPQYRIPSRLRALVEARDQDCGYPICRRPASQCDLDHTVPYDQGGLTCRCNLSAGCRRHHRMKTLSSWRLRQPRPGTLIWIAPSKVTWTASPEPHPI